MPKLPWTGGPMADSARDDDAETIVLGSFLQLHSYRDIPGFLRAAARIRSQVLASPGAMGVSLIAQPTRRTFWTLSAWTDQAALDAFVRAVPHMDVMRKYRGRLRASAFTTWTVAASDLPKPRSNAKELWRAAEARLAETKNGATT